MANPFTRYIANIKFALRDSNEFVLIFMSDGLVFAVETLTETFLTNTKGKIDLAHVSRYPLVDLKQNFLLTLGENGLHGALHTLKIERGTKKDPDLNRVSLILVKEFDYTLPNCMGRKEKLPAEKSVFKIELLPLQSLIVIA